MTNGSVHHDQNDPIFNFLFEYYHLKPRILLQWTPGFDVYLLDADPSLKGACPRSQKCGGSQDSRTVIVVALPYADNSSSTRRRLGARSDLYDE